MLHKEVCFFVGKCGTAIYTKLETATTKKKNCGYVKTKYQIGDMLKLSIKLGMLKLKIKLEIC